MVLSTAIDIAEELRLPLTYKNMHKDLSAGDRVLLADGLLEFKVDSVAGREIACTVIEGGTLTSNKGVIVPTATLRVPVLSKKDRDDLDFAVKNGADFIAMSFVMTKKDVLQMRRLITAAEKRHFGRTVNKTAHDQTTTGIIVKIEKHEALDNFDEILSVTDGVMVARGDLGLEIPFEAVPIAQKMIINKCLKEAKPVITATQMLASMTEHPRPTRAEVSDVANAVIDHTDAVMLSDETAVGKYPVKAVQTMAKIAKETEKSPYDDLDHGGLHYSMLADATISSAASSLAEINEAEAIVVATLSGRTARVVSRFRPELPILASALNETLGRQMNLSWGVTPFNHKYQRNLPAMIKKLVSMIRRQGLVARGDEVVIVAGDPPGSGVVNYVKVEKI